MFECEKKNTCRNYPIRCSSCGANSDIYNHYPCYQHKDIVQVVRCKDCKYSEDMFMSGIYCNHPDNRNPLGCRPDDFCNDGERKEGETE